MGVETNPFLGLGYMFNRKANPEAFDRALEALMEMEEAEGDISVVVPGWGDKPIYLDLFQDLYCGEWLFLGTGKVGDPQEIVKIGSIFEGNGDDIYAAVKKLFEDNPEFLKTGDFGIWGGTYYT